MNNNYKFFQNRDCEFFPCHKVKDEDKFNCLFCYCPLYFDESCIGSPEYIVNGRGQKIKDCSSCLVVHRPEMYDKVIAHLQRQEEILHVDLRKLRQQIKDRLIQITHINDMEPDMCVEHQREAEIVLDRIMTKNASETSVECQVSVLLQPFAVECVHEGYFEFGRKRIKCNVLEQLDLSSVENGYLYAFHAPEIDIESAGSVLEQYYMEAFQVACMDVIRGWIQGYLERKNSVYDNRYCSPSFGSGYYGMGMDTIPELLGLMDASQVGVSWNGERMSPKMSLVGTYLIAGEDVFAMDSDCRDCIGQSGGCEFCIKH